MKIANRKIPLPVVSVTVSAAEFEELERVVGLLASERRVVDLLKKALSVGERTSCRSGSVRRSMKSFCQRSTF